MASKCSCGTCGVTNPRWCRALPEAWIVHLPGHEVKIVVKYNTAVECIDGCSVNTTTRTPNQNRERKRKGYSPEPQPGPRKTGRLGAGKACREAGSAPEYGFDGTRNELLSRGMAGRGAASCGSRNPGGQNRGRAGWPRGRAAPASEEAVACLRCRNAGKSVWKKYWSILSTNIDATGRAKKRTVPGANEPTCAYRRKHEPDCAGWPNDITIVHT